MSIEKWFLVPRTPAECYVYKKLATWVIIDEILTRFPSVTGKGVPSHYSKHCRLLRPILNLVENTKHLFWRNKACEPLKNCPIGVHENNNR